jgi:hypothetical protein
MASAGLGVFTRACAKEINSPENLLPAFTQKWRGNQPTPPAFLRVLQRTENCGDEVRAKHGDK